MDRLNILYRGPLSSCNYDCHYCPFAKRHESAAELAYDRTCLERFVAWLKERTNRPHGVFFTPWGEALTRRWYHNAIIELSHCDHIDRLAVQTNLSAPLDWLQNSRCDRVALWCTYHPDEVSRDQFLSRCRELESLKIRYSVGVVGLKEHADEIERLRAELPSNVYLWINAFKSSGPTDERLATFFSQIDPLYPFNNVHHSSFGQHCDTGWTTISVDGEGNVRRCHFIADVLGNIYDGEVEQLLHPRRCTNQHCGCHIGYVHMPQLGLKKIFGENILERIPLNLDEASSQKIRSQCDA